jgi:tRNA A37 threonylcarbamoyladenosine modification protein TsaB
MALAWQGQLACQQSPIGAVMDARMGQIYWAVYDFAHGCQVLEADKIATVDQLQTQGVPKTVAGDVHLFENALVKVENQVLSAQSNVDIKSLLSLVETGLAQGFLDWDEGMALPIYLRNDVAHLPKK